MNRLPALALLGIAAALDAHADPLVYKCAHGNAPQWFEFTDAYQPGCTPVELPGYDQGSETMRIPRGRDGHFAVQGKVNGVPVRFLVDTGASTVAISDQVAQAGNLPRGTQVVAQTANGTRNVQSVDNIKVSIGSMAPVETTVAAGFAGGAPDSALLGQSFLKHYDIRINGDDMVLTRRTR